MKKYSISSVCAFAILVGSMTLLPVKQAEAGFGCWAQAYTDVMYIAWKGRLVGSFSDHLGYHWSFCL